MVFLPKLTRGIGRGLAFRPWPSPPPPPPTNLSQTRSSRCSSRDNKILYLMQLQQCGPCQQNIPARFIMTYAVFVAKKPFTIFVEAERQCVVCDVGVDVSICRKCMIPWGQHYLDHITLCDCPKELTDRITETGTIKWFCLGCVADQAYWLNITHLLSKESLRQVELIERECDVRGGRCPLKFVVTPIPLAVSIRPAARPPALQSRCYHGVVFAQGGSINYATELWETSPSYDIEAAR